jgi:hypothetical protein
MKLNVVMTYFEIILIYSLEDRQFADKLQIVLHSRRAFLSYEGGDISSLQDVIHSFFEICCGRYLRKILP